MRRSDSAIQNLPQRILAAWAMIITVASMLSSHAATTNFALGAESYMVRLSEDLPPASHGNDGDETTYTFSTSLTVDAYWEVDLGELRALETIRVLPIPGFEQRMSHATVRLYDAAHRSVFAQHLTGISEMFIVNLPGPVLARYVRVGFENKERSSPVGALEWWLGIREVEVFGRPADEVGIREFTAVPREIAAGTHTQLHWRQSGLDELRIYSEFGLMHALMPMAETGAFTVAPVSSTVYMLVGTNSTAAFARFVTVEVNGQKLPPRISEFAASNRLSLRDGHSNTPDWIELQNPNNTPLALDGYGLSDDPSNPMKWRFPAVTLPPHGFLVVFASDRAGSPDPGGFLHAGFSLKASGESIVLTAPDGRMADSILSYPPQREDLAYGRSAGGGWTFLEPTPGKPNLAITYTGWLQPLTFSQTRGLQTNAFDLVLHNPNPDSEIYFSTDGTEPSMPFAQSLTIDNTTCVRATVRRHGYKSPPVQTHTYIFLDKVAASPVMNPAIAQDPRYAQRLRKGLAELPILSISVPMLPDDWNEQPASVEVFWPDGAAPVQENCGVARFGGSWTSFAKKNYRLKFRKEYGTRKFKLPLFRGHERGIPIPEAFDELDLQGGGHDMLQRGFYMAGRFTEDTMLDMGSLNPHGRFVHLYFNGIYWGQYHARERLTDAFLADYLGGRTEDYVNVRGNDNVGNRFVPGTPEPPHRAPWESVLANRHSFAALSPFLDVRHYVDFMLMWNYGNAESEYRAAGPIRPGSGFKFWLGDADGYLRTSALDLDQLDNDGPAGIFGALVAEKHPDFMMLLADRIYQHFFNDGALTPARNRQRLDQRMHEIANSHIAECARWNYRTPATWESAAEEIRTRLFPFRTATLFSQLRSRGWYPPIDPPRFNQHGGRVPDGFTLTISAATGTLYYTLDGSDPRLPGGSIAPNVISTPTELILRSPTLVKARVKSGETWSALAEARFLPGDSESPPTIDPGLKLQWARSGPGMRPNFSFSTAAPGTYEVQFTHRLDPPDWQPLQRIENAAAGIHSIPPPPDSQQVFLRVVRVHPNHL